MAAHECRVPRNWIERMCSFRAKSTLSGNRFHGGDVEPGVSTSFDQESPVQGVNGPQREHKGPQLSLLQSQRAAPASL